MTVDQPTVMQILVAWRHNKWVVARNAVEVGAYAYRVHAIEMAQRLSAEARKLGIACYMLVRDKGGQWQERSCPRPLPEEPSG
ncbi:hypothetical protein [Phenylobacterium sp.]|jgi:hypothetical protein|uniref:hypothetical protein n=1 Tax=Phenylobacterium sp. TaxID=1871053 RepID=UPI002F946BE2